MSCNYKCHVALPRGATVGLQFVIVVFPDHTHLLFIVSLEDITRFVGSL